MNARTHLFDVLVRHQPHLCRNLGTVEPARQRVPFPEETMQVVEAMVGPDRAGKCVSVVAQQEVQARSLGQFATSQATALDLDEIT